MSADLYATHWGGQTWLADEYDDTEPADTYQPAATGDTGDQEPDFTPQPDDQQMVAIPMTDQPADRPTGQADEARPAEHTWAAELYDPLAEEWVPGTRYADRDRAVNALNHANTVGPKWRDGTPVQRRLVRATTTYTVEQPAAAPDAQ